MEQGKGSQIKGFKHKYIYIYKAEDKMVEHNCGKIIGNKHNLKQMH